VLQTQVATENPPIESVGTSTVHPTSTALEEQELEVMRPPLQETAEMDSAAVAVVVAAGVETVSTLAQAVAAATATSASGLGDNHANGDHRQHHG
jgi:Mrp family chromosome partitioning ATPase